MSVELEKEALDVAKWWTYHKGNIPDMQKRVEFQGKAIDHLLWLLGRAIQDIKTLEHRAKLGERGVPSILLPMGVKLHDGIRARN